MRVALPLQLLLGVVLAFALPGCGSSRAGFSADEDAFPPPAGAANQKPPAPIVFTEAPTPGKHSDDHVVYGSDFSDDPEDSSTDFDNLEINPALKSKLAVLRVGSERTDSHLLSVFAGVKNKSGRRLNIEMQTVYRDKAGHPLTDSRGSWIPITLKPHEETQYRSVAISEDASDFLVRIRHAPPADPTTP